MAANNPIGKEMNMAISETMAVPATSGRTPKLGGANSGAHLRPNRKSVMGTSRRNSIVSNNSTPMMPTVVKIETAAQRNSAAAIPPSLARRQAVPVRAGGEIVICFEAGKVSMRCASIINASDC